MYHKLYSKKYALHNPADCRAILDLSKGNMLCSSGVNKQIVICENDVSFLAKLSFKSWVFNSGARGPQAVWQVVLCGPRPHLLVIYSFTL